MALKLVFVFICWMSLVFTSKESPIKGSTFPPEPLVVEHSHGIHVLNADDSTILNEDETSDTKMMNQEANRSNYSRQLDFASTLGYDEWWFATTRRPQISLKDFPGRPGVASWKEISPVAPADNRKSRKIGPTAEGVSSSGWCLKMNCLSHLFSYLLMIIFIRRFCWT